MLVITAPETLTSARFSIEGDCAARTYPGLHNDPNRWNGWAEPLFTREVAQEVITEVTTSWPEGDDGHYVFTWDGDTLVVSVPDEDITWSIEPYVLDGVYLYDMGLGWVWDTVDCTGCDRCQSV